VPEENYWIDSPIVLAFCRIINCVDYSEEERFKVLNEVLKTDMDINLKLSPLGSTMSGWICPRDRQVVQQILVHYPEKNPVVLEIGVYGGGCACAMLMARPDCSYIGIDNWSEAPIEDFVKNTKPFRDRVEIITGDSREVGKGWNRPLDVVLIDGGHDYDVAISDVKNFVPWVKVGGIVMVDDYGTHGDVTKVVDKCLLGNPEFELVRKPDSPYGMAEKLIVFRKVKK